MKLSTVYELARHDHRVKQDELRDSFARSALEGVLAISAKAREDQIGEIARLAYKIADAMMEARKND